ARHLHFFAAMAEAASPELRGPSMVDWLDRLDAEIENLGAALEWGLESESETAIRMGAALLDYWVARQPSPDNEARLVAAVGAARRMVAGPPEATVDQRALAARLLGKAALKWSLSGRADAAAAWAGEALDLAMSVDRPDALIPAMLSKATTTIFTGARDGIHGRLDDVVRLATRTGDDFSIAFAASGIAISMNAGDAAAIERLLSVGVAAAQRSGNPHVIALTSLSRGTLLARSGQYEEARILLHEAVERFAEVGDERLAEAARSELAHLVRRSGALDEALALYRVSIGGWVRSGNRGAVAHQLESIAFALVARGAVDRAARLLGAASALRETVNSPMTAVEQDEHDEWLGRLRGAAGAASLEDAMATGRRLSMTEAVALAISSPEPGS
ncbi:MAG: tetratricopeptide repeat protein, partial [Chloroflexi bacterium]|nr:tetratricopeptide repeat protein [Chloroflexota bacterium]